MHTARILPFRAAQPAVSSACRWSSAIESVAATNLRIAFAWQRILLRAWLLG